METVTLNKIARCSRCQATLTADEVRGDWLCASCTRGILVVDDPCESKLADPEVARRWYADAREHFGLPPAAEPIEVIPAPDMQQVFNGFAQAAQIFSVGDYVRWEPPKAPYKWVEGEVLEMRGLRSHGVAVLMTCATSDHECAPRVGERVYIQEGAAPPGSIRRIPRPADPSLDCARCGVRFDYYGQAAEHRCATLRTTGTISGTFADGPTNKVIGVNHQHDGIETPVGTLGKLCGARVPDPDDQWYPGARDLSCKLPPHDRDQDHKDGAFGWSDPPRTDGFPQSKIDEIKAMMLATKRGGR